ncbi:hypothetical protein HK104_003928 [Borealophlyctis nickersoniae]|nr:hypothetical protein HK104_003928 [Borealophlyctis nickersoniae]
MRWGVWRLVGRVRDVYGDVKREEVEDVWEVEIGRERDEEGEGEKEEEVERDGEEEEEKSLLCVSVNVKKRPK